MTETNPMSEKLITEFTDHYMEKLFYFCLKKTGSSAEAEDLTQDVALNILAALNKGTIPTSFSAWVWRIARNRYCAWAENKHRNAEAVTGADIGDYEIEDESDSSLDQMIRSEQLALLRRELAFIRGEYREIVLAHYLDNRSVRDVAASLSLSEAAVKQRLYRARTILKEGMNMTREFGVRSYKPEDIYYSMIVARPGSKDQPNSIMKHKLYVNIFLEAYGNPSTAEDLSLELGVALPYMEDELKYLTRETFLMEKDGKYQTAFPIMSRCAQEQTQVAWLTATPDITKALMDFIEKLNDAFTAQGYAYYGTGQDYESAKWTFLMLACEYFKCQSMDFQGTTKRPDDGQWDVIGYQYPNDKMARPVFVENTVAPGENYLLQQFRYKFEGVSDHPAFLTEEEAKVLYDSVIGKIEESNLETAAKLAERGYLRKNGDAYEPAIPVLKKQEIDDAVKALDEKTLSELTACAEKAKRLLADLYHKISETIRCDLPAGISKDKYLFGLVSTENASVRGYVIAEALRQGYLLPTEKVSPAIGACIDLI